MSRSDEFGGEDAAAKLFNELDGTICPRIDWVVSADCIFGGEGPRGVSCPVPSIAFAFVPRAAVLSEGYLILTMIYSTVHVLALSSTYWYLVRVFAMDHHEIARRKRLLLHRPQRSSRALRPWRVRISLSVLGPYSGTYTTAGLLACQLCHLFARQARAHW